MAYSGKFKPKNLGKYKGDPNKITYRSLWEAKLMQICDTNPNIIKWNSEEIVIPYFDPIKNRQRRYYMDFWAIMKKPNGETFEMLIEVKPHKESYFWVKALKEGTEPSAPRPMPKSANPKVMARWYSECSTAATNTAKWNATLKYCKEYERKTGKKMIFKIFTEHELNIDQGKARTERKRAATKNYKAAQKARRT